MLSAWCAKLVLKTCRLNFHNRNQSILKEVFLMACRNLNGIFQDQKETGCGSYGVMIMKVGHYNQQDGQSQQVVVKVRRDIRGNEREFSKEARHLNRVNGQTLCRL